MNTVYKLIVIAALTLNAVSCDKVDDLLTFTFNNQTTFTIENQYGSDVPFTVPTPDVTTNSSQKFENNNTASDLVKEINLNQMTLTIQSPDDFTFSFLKSLHIYISTEQVEETEIAFKDDIPEEATSIDMETYNDKDLSPYVKGDTYDLRFEAVTREAFAQDVTIKAEMEYKVRADPL
ncbi:MAG: hypothetical protein K9J27_01205 [Bacteroidales bacterium]|nr:hypothetical protein [Bacteroidales bacterium]MCF8333405.1 hypothetical protein [Bacteroidales bacterium]